MSPLDVNTGLRRIGEYLPCSPPEIDWALSVQAMESASGNLKRLGEILIGRHHVTQEILADALESQLIDRLRVSSLLKDLSREELARIAEHTDLIALQSGDILFQEGHRGDSAYIMLAGRLLLSRSTGQTECPAGAVISGDVLGEEECFADGVRCCSANATEPSLLLKIRYDLIPRCANYREKTPFLRSPAGVAGRACAVLRADRAYLFVRNQQTGELSGTVGEGEEACEFRIMAGTDIAGWVALKRQIVNLREAYLDPRFDPAIDVLTGYWTRTLLAAPVLGDCGEVLGVLEVVNKRSGWFDADDEAFLHAVIQQCASALRTSSAP